MPIARLRDRTVIAVSGADAFAFLQNIVTADMQEVDRQGAGYGALLTPQGKIVCDFLIFAAENGGYHLDVRAEAAGNLIKRLTLYKLRADVTIGLETDLAVFAAWNGGEVPPDAHADPRTAALGSRWVASADTISTAPGDERWHDHRIALAIPEGGIDFLFEDAFAHDAAMDSLNGVAFQKGCFIGQEVVSRMRHRGTARRRIVRLSGDADLPETGTEITAGGRPLGRLGSSSGHAGIGLVRLDRVEKARAAGEPLQAGAVTLDIALPDWAGYRWPSESAVS